MIVDRVCVVRVVDASADPWTCCFVACCAAKELLPIVKIHVAARCEKQAKAVIGRLPVPSGVGLRPLQPSQLALSTNYYTRLGQIVLMRVEQA